jgi:hypothetical protein
MKIRIMKSNRSILKKYAAKLVLTVMVTLSLKACSKEEYPSGTIKVTTAKPTVGFTFRIPKDSQNLTIDWGDGKKSNVNDATYDVLLNEFRELLFSHDYSNTTERTIVVSGSITDFNCRGMQVTHLYLSRIKTLVSLDCSENILTALDVSTNTALNRLECDFNELTSLDVSKNKSLYRLSCVGNQLAAFALNDLFRSLPNKRGYEYNEIGTIYISHNNPGPLDNPGVWDCDRSIAEEKGWEFRTLRH